MDTIWGCDPEQMDELVEKFVERAERLIELIELLRGSAAAVSWTGPDADGFRERMGAVATEATATGRRVSQCGQQLGEEAAEQEAASTPDRHSPGSALPVTASLPEKLRAGAEKLWEDMQPRPFDLDELFKDVEIEGPITHPYLDHPRRDVEQPPRPSSLPAGEDYGLDPEIVAKVREEREDIVGVIPYAGAVQTAMDVHEKIGKGLDWAEEKLEDAGLEELKPVVSAARVPHAIAEGVLGEESGPGRFLSGIDNSAANVVQTTQEVAEALGDGDLSAAARAGERGLFRGAGNGFQLMMFGDPMHTITDTAAETSGALADAIEPISPEAAQHLRTGEEFMRSTHDDYTWRTDSERLYDARRQYIPMPWDETA